MKGFTMGDIVKRVWWRTYWRIYRLFRKPRPAGIYIDGELVNGQIIVTMNGETRVLGDTSNPFYWRRENEEDTKPDQ
jgi:hypothetical protein